MKNKETLEEALSKVLESKKYPTWLEIAIIGANWKEENIQIQILDVDNIYAHVENGVVIIEKNDKGKISYSEEEVLPLFEILQKCKEYFLLKTDKYSDERADAIIDVLKQFKKK
jgi:hypothetical protein